MRDSEGNSTAVLRCNNANSSLTIWLKNKVMNKRIGSVQIESEVLRNPVQHLAAPLWCSVLVFLSSLICSLKYWFRTVLRPTRFKRAVLALF